MPPHQRDTFIHLRPLPRPPFKPIRRRRLSFFVELFEFFELAEPFHVLGLHFIENIGGMDELQVAYLGMFHACVLGKDFLFVLRKEGRMLVVGVECGGEGVEERERGCGWGGANVEVGGRGTCVWLKGKRVVTFSLPSPDLGNLALTQCPKVVGFTFMANFNVLSASSEGNGTTLSSRYTSFECLSHL
jgi:hypothetical protein